MHIQCKYNQARRPQPESAPISRIIMYKYIYIYIYSYVSTKLTKRHKHDGNKQYSNTLVRICGNADCVERWKSLHALFCLAKMYRKRCNLCLPITVQFIINKSWLNFLGGPPKPKSSKQRENPSDKNMHCRTVIQHPIHPTNQFFLNHGKSVRQPMRKLNV